MLSYALVVSTVNSIPATCGNPPTAVGVQYVDASRASRSSAPVTYTTVIVFPNGRTVFTSFLVMLPLLMAALIPPPFTMATAFAVSTERLPSSFKTVHMMASATRSPRFVSSVLLPGSLSPLRFTRDCAKTMLYSPFTLSMISWAYPDTATSFAMS